MAYHENVGFPPSSVQREEGSAPGSCGPRSGKVYSIFTTQNLFYYQGQKPAINTHLVQLLRTHFMALPRQKGNQELYSLTA